MKNLLAAAVLLSSFTAYAAGGSLSPVTAERIRGLTLEGLACAYNLDMDRATRCFDEASALEPSHPRPYVGKAAMLFWRLIIARQEADKDTFFTLTERAMDLADQFEATYGKDADVEQCLGILYGYRAFVEGRTRSYLKAAWDGKKSYDHFVDALEIDPHLYDAYLGIGLFHYFITFIPKPLQWVVSVMGIEGNNVLGLREIRLAAEKGTYAKVEAEFYLAQFLPWEEGDFDTGRNILQRLHEDYPRNSIVTYTLAVWQIRQNNPAQAEPELRSVLDADDAVTSALRPFARYKLAECMFRLARFGDACEMYRQFLAGLTGGTYRATAEYRQGYCFEIAGRRDSAMACYRRAVEADHKFGDDAYAGRKAALRLESPLHPSDTLLTSGQNALKSGDYATAGVRFRALVNISSPESDDYREGLYGIGETYFEQGSFAPALAMYREVLGSSPRNEKWLSPWAHFQSGICLNKLGDPSAAEKEFRSVLDQEEYDFENWLHFRAEREGDRLTKRK
jgi:tetratricopeptide (TPR) repeat protein